MKKIMRIIFSDRVAEKTDLQKSMKYKLQKILVLLAAVLCLLPFAAAGIACLRSYSLALQEEAARETAIVAHALAGDVEKWLGRHAHRLSSVWGGAEGGSGDDVSPLSAPSPLLSPTGPEFVSFVIHDSKQQPDLGAVYGHTFGGLGFSWDDFASRVRSGGCCAWSPAFKALEGGPWIAAVGSPCSGGVAVGLLDLSGLEPLLGKSLPNAHWKAVIVQQDGQAIAASGAGDASLVQALAPQTSLAETFALYSEKDYLAAWKAVENTEWRVLAAWDQREASAPARRINRVFWAGALLTLGLSLALGLWLFRNVDPSHSREDFLASQERRKRGLALHSPFVSMRRMAAAGGSQQHNEERCLAILEGIQDAYYEADLQGNIVLCNDSLCQMSGYTREEIAVMGFHDLMDEQRLDAAAEAFASVYESEKPLEQSPWDMVRKDGALLHVEGSISLIRSNGEKTGFRGIIRDVTQRLSVESELALTKTFLENLMESSPDTIVSTDMHGAVQYVTPLVHDLLGYTQQEMLGTRVSCYYCRGVEDARAIMAGLREREGITGHNLQMRTKDGRIIDVSASVSLLRNEDGQVVGTLGLLRDETYHKRLEDSLQHAQRMEAMGTLAGGVAHDFNNLLMGMQGYVSLMLLETQPDKPEYVRLKKIEKQIHSGSELTRQLLGLARGGQYEVRPENPEKLVAGAAEMFGRTRKEVRIHQHTVSPLWAVQCDRGQIEQVLLNLFVNAWHAMPNGGDLHLCLENLVLSADDSESCGLPAGDYVHISVRDTGEGMDEETRRKAFDPFFTTKKRGRGTGLGLTTSYNIMKNHGGAITVESQPGKGSTFHLHLPASRERAEAPVNVESSIRRGSQTVLLVDDEDTVLEVGAEMIRALGYTVFTAGSGMEAVQCVEKKGESIDLVILDVVMPGMSGEETFARLKGMDPEIKVLLSSGYSAEGQAARILEKGGMAFVQKPFSINTLSNALHEALARE